MTRLTLDDDVAPELLEAGLASVGLTIIERIAAGDGTEWTIADHVQIARFVRGLAAVGLALSNLPSGGLRIHRAASLAQVIDLSARREARTDAQLRQGFRALFDPRGPGAA